MANQQFTVLLHLTTECVEEVDGGKIADWITDNLRDADTARVSAVVVRPGFSDLVRDGDKDDCCHYR